MRLTSFLLLAVFTTAASAQQQTLLSGEIESGGYGAPVFRLSWLDGETAVVLGGKGGWIINHTFVLGGAGYGFATAHQIDEDDAVFERRVEGGYGGILLEYYFVPEQILNFSISSLVGAGGFALLRGNRLDGRSFTIDDTAFFVVEPGAAVQLNVTTFFRVGLEANYRFIVGSNLLGFSDSDLSGASAGLSLQFGSF